MAKIFGRQVKLADQSRRANHFIRTDAIGDVAAVAIDELAHPKLASDCADFLLDGFGFRREKQTRVGSGAMLGRAIDG